MEECFGIDAGRLPQRSVVPLDIESDGKSIKVTSSSDNVNTALAALEGMDVTEANNLIFVNSGETLISIKKPGVTGGLVLSIFGLLFCVASYVAAGVYCKKCTKTID